MNSYFILILSVPYLLLLIFYVIVLVFNRIVVSDQKREHHEKRQNQTLIPVYIVISFFNEARILNEKIKNLLELDYPLLHFIFVNDFSNDGSTEIVRSYPDEAGTERTFRTGCRLNHPKGVGAKSQRVAACRNFEKRTGSLLYS